MAFPLQRLSRIDAAQPCLSAQLQSWLLPIPAPCLWGSLCAAMHSVGMWMGPGCGGHVLHRAEPSRGVVSMCLDKWSLLGVW